jgi:hypothetical protein
LRRDATPAVRHQRRGQSPDDLRELPRKAEPAKLALLEEAAGWADARRSAKRRQRALPLRLRAGPVQPGISIAKALAQDSGKIKDASPPRSKLEPKHADAHTAFGSYRAEIIDKVGGIVAGMTVRREKDSALEHYQKALKLNRIPPLPGSNTRTAHPARRQGRMAKPRSSIRSGLKPADAMERLDVDSPPEPSNRAALSRMTAIPGLVQG